MRNLKKVLALALATVMLLGMMAMASAADYADETAIADKYDVAVDVMNKIGVFEGDPAGNFNPANNLSRAEAAKVITFVALTKANASKLTTAADPFEDVAADHWAAGSIRYAKNLGIIAGMTETTFAPNEKVTGFQMAKMLLVVLGYKAEVEGYVGTADWDINVQLDANAAGLMKGLDIDLADAITREEAAQMAFNALNAKTVEYVGASSILVNGIVIQNGGVLTEGKLLREKLYTKLAPSTKVDAFGYAYDTWLYDGKECAAAADYSVLATYTGDLAALTKGALFALVGKETATVTVPYYVNGSDTAAGSFTVAKADKTKTAAADKLLTGYNGEVVKVVKNNDKPVIMIEDMTVGQVTKVTDADAAKEIKRSVTIAGKTFETADFAKDQYVKYYLQDNAGTDNDKIIAVEAIDAADVVKGIVTQVAGVNGTKATAVYVAGVEYPVAAQFQTNRFTVGGTTEQNVVLENGYVVAVTTQAVGNPDVIADYVYVTAQNVNAVAQEWGSTAKPVYETQVVYMDGTVATVKTEAKLGVSQDIQAKTVYVMTEEKGLKVFEPVAAVDLQLNATTNKYYANAAATNYFYGAQSGQIDFKNDKLDTFGSQKAYFTADTKVLYVDFNQAGTLVEAAKVSALPTTGTVTPIGAIYSFDATAQACEVEVIIIETEIAVAAVDLYYVVGTVLGTVYDATAADGAGDTFNLVAAYEIATGEKKTVRVQSAYNGFYLLSNVDKYGEYTFTTTGLPAAVTNATTVTAAAKSVSAYGNLLTMGSFTDKDVSEFVIVDVKAGAVDTVAELVAKSNEGTTGKAITYYTFTIGTGSDAVDYIVVTAY